MPTAAVRLGGEPQAEVIVSSARFKGERYEILARWPGTNSGEALQFWHEAPIAPETRLPVAFDPDRLRLYPEEPHA